MGEGEQKLSPPGAPLFPLLCLGAPVGRAVPGAGAKINPPLDFAIVKSNSCSKHSQSKAKEFSVQKRWNPHPSDPQHSQSTYPHAPLLLLCYGASIYKLSHYMRSRGAGDAHRARCPGGGGLYGPPASFLFGQGLASCGSQDKNCPFPGRGA